MSRSRKYREEPLERACGWRSRVVVRSRRSLVISGPTPRRCGSGCQAEADQGLRPDLPTSDEREEVNAARELRAAARERDLEVGERLFCQRARHRRTDVSRYIGEHLDRFAVEQICRTLGVWCPPTTSDAAGNGRCGRSRTSGCSLGSASSTPPRPTTPTTNSGSIISARRPGRAANRYSSAKTYAATTRGFQIRYLEFQSRGDTGLEALLRRRRRGPLPSPAAISHQPSGSRPIRRRSTWSNR